MTELFQTSPPSVSRSLISLADLDLTISIQLSIAWAGEGGEEEPRLRWWRSDLSSEFGGEDLFQHQQLLPNTAAWAVLQAVREVARRVDATRRAQLHDPDLIISPFHLGFVRDERIDERFQEIKRSGKAPSDALPLFKKVTSQGWNRSMFEQWAQSYGSFETLPVPSGRRLKGQAPADLPSIMHRLVSALIPLSDSYPLPHFRSDKA